MGPDQRSLRPHNLLSAHLHPHRHWLRDAEEAEPAARTRPHQTLVKTHTYQQLGVQAIFSSCTSGILESGPDSIVCTVYFV